MNHCHTSAQERAYSEHKGQLDQEDAAIDSVSLEVFDSINAALIDAAKSGNAGSWGNHYRVVTLDPICFAVFQELMDNPDGLTMNQAIDRVVEKTLAEQDGI